MDVDLAEYDQVDEAKFFIGMKDQQATGTDLLTTYSSEQSKSDDLANCENDFVFLPAPMVVAPPVTTPKPSANPTSATKTPAPDETPRGNNEPVPQVNYFAPKGKSTHRVVITPDQLDIRSHQPMNPNKHKDTSATKKSDFGTSNNAPRVTHPLMTIHTNASNNPFHSMHQAEEPNNSTLAKQSTQPFWMRHENFSNKPVGLLEVNIPPESSQTANHLSDLLHQIVTKSDSIYIAIPCQFCHEPKACPPSDISAWLKHMNQAHNCKVCPICNRLVGLGPLRDIEIMRKHVVAHIDNNWLESDSFKTNFSFGLQHHWFSSGLCSVKDPRAYSRYR